MKYEPRRSGRIAVTDKTNADRVLRRTYAQMAADISYLSDRLFNELSPREQYKLKRNETVYCGCLAPGGYEFAVTFFAIWSIGGCIVPLCVSHPPLEMADLVRRAEVAVICAHPKYAELAKRTASELSNSATKVLVSNLAESDGEQRRVFIDNSRKINPDNDAVIVFTSGTTGPPKGCCYTHRALENRPEKLANEYLQWNISSSDILMHVLPVHHTAGIFSAFLPYMYEGAEIEFFPSNPFNAEAVWERWKLGGLTVFNGVPTMWTRLMRHYESLISVKSSQERAEWEEAARSFRLMFSGTAAFPAPLKSKWIKMLEGRVKICERYGATEFGMCFCTSTWDNNVPDGSVGYALPGVEIRLSEGEIGEILVKTPWMFSRYLNDRTATRNAFTDDGFYKTGDIASRQGKYYSITGRASVDVIKSGGYKLSALDIERAMLSLDYIDEACVMGIDDEEWGQRVAALVVLQNRASLEIDQLRTDLKQYLASYRLPNVLRVVKAIPKSYTGKMVKKKIVSEFFDDLSHGDIQFYSRTGLPMLATKL